MTKPNHCIWIIRTHYTFVSTNEQFAPKWRRPCQGTAAFNYYHPIYMILESIWRYSILSYLYLILHLYFTNILIRLGEIKNKISKSRLATRVFLWLISGLSVIKITISSLLRKIEKKLVKQNKTVCYPTHLNSTHRTWKRLYLIRGCWNTKL